MANGTFRGLCNCELPFTQQPDSSFILGQPCPVKPAGTPMIEMNQACQVCPYKGLDLPRLWAEQASQQQQAQLQTQQAQAQAPAPTVVPTQQVPLQASVQAPAQKMPELSTLPTAMHVEAAPSAAAPPVGQVISLAALSAAQAPDEALIVEQALARLAEETGQSSGSSVGGISAHILEHTKCWLRAHRALVLGLQPVKRSEAYAWGSLYHEALARHYASGGNLEETLKPIEACRLAGASRIAAEVNALVMAQLTNPEFVEEETKTWCPRAVENNAVAWSEPVKINGKVWKIPFSCRHDLLVHVRQPYEPVPGAGKADNMMVVDHKTTSSMTQDLIKGYILDYQLMVNCFIFRENEEHIYGKLRGFIVTIAAKHKNPGPQSFHRVRDVVDDGILGRFYKDELLPRASELIRRLTDDSIRKDASQWPMNRQECVGKFLCPYFNMCGYGETSDFFVDEKRILDPSSLQKPPSGYKGALVASPEAVTATEEKTKKRKVKTDDKKAYAERLIASFVSDLAKRPQFGREHHLVAGHTEKSVIGTLVDQCILTFRLAFANAGGVDAEVEWPLSETETAKLTLKARGVGFVGPCGKGQIYWKDIVEPICKDWWNLANLDPTTASKELGTVAPQASAPPAPPQSPTQG